MIFKCKICGGALEFLEGSTVCECQHCGTKQTLPKNSSEHSNTLYERADHFRRNNDFDKAIGIYEQILNKDNTDAEAYWSLVLCRYGIEYVEDPKSNKRIATVNRMQYTSVLADEDYKSALKYADYEQKEIYEAEAKEIDSIQKGILAISQKEEPFDVFICYKESDNSGRRTPDSVLANELYHQLDNEGYKVFFSRITLEDKLGTAYEPYIFAALNSAKVMVVIGTKPEYFNAVWVRNEWSRFLALIKNGANKVLIPAYRDMDPYNLPEEFSHLQAQDMSKLGFMQDLIRGIEKLTSASKPKYVKEQPVQSGANTAPLLRRVYLFLEDGAWESADEYCEKVLDLDPECGEAYLGKMMVDLKIRQREKLSEQSEPFDNNPNYQKALRFGDDKLQNELKNYIETITNRAEHTRFLAIYKKGVALLEIAKTEEDYKDAFRIFNSILEFEDSKEKAIECEQKAIEIRFSSLYSEAVALMKLAKVAEDFEKASNAFLKIKEYKDSEKLAKDCADKANNINKNVIYSAAVALMNGNKVRNYKKAIVEFEKISGFKDVDSKIEYCNKKIEQINSALSASGLAKQAKAEERAEAFKEKLPLIKKISLIVVPVLVIAIVAATVLPKIDWSESGVENNTSTESISIESAEEIEIKEIKKSLSGVKVGEYVKFGTYEQDNDLSNGKEEIEWRVLDIVDGKILLMSKCSLDYKKYNEKTENVTWETCSLRNWLNSDFFNEAFSKAEKTLIPTVTVTADKFHSHPATDPGNDTKDKVFLLSSKEVEKYLLQKSDRIGENTKYVKAQPDFSYDDDKWWWLRSPGSNNSQAANIYCVFGTVGFGFMTVGTLQPIRPVIWVEAGAVFNKGEDNITSSKEKNDQPIENNSTNINANISSNVTYTYKLLNNGTVEITGLDTARNISITSLDIPSTIDGYNVTSISGMSIFSLFQNLSSVTIPDSVTNISGGAFAHTKKLTQINIPNNVTNIGDHAFADCTSLVSITIPNSVSSIGFNAFANCGSLTSINIPNSVSSIGDSAFSGCSSLTTVNLPNNIDSIGSSTFYNCSNLKSIAICDGVTKIDDCAFSGCSKLFSIKIPNSVTYIGYKVFSGCSSLTTITLPDSINASLSNSWGLIECVALKTVNFYSEKGKNNFELYNYSFTEEKNIIILE